MLPETAPGAGKRVVSVRSRLLVAVGCLVCGAGLMFLIWQGWQWRERIRMFHGVRAALAESDFERARVYLDQAAPRFSATGQFIYWEAVFARREGRLADAEALLRQAAELGWSTSEIELQRCLTVAQSGRINQVQARLNEIIQAGTSDDVAEQIYEATAKGQLASYQLKDAWECINFWLKWQPDNLRARQWRGQISEMVGDRLGAITEYLDILKLDPNAREVRRRLGSVLLSLNRVEEAQEHFDWLCAHPPTDAAARIGLVTCKRRMGELDAARDLAELVLELDLSPDLKAQAQLELGMTLLALREPERAVGLLELAAKEMPGDQELQFALSRTYSQLGQPAAAERHSKLAREFETTEVRTREILEQLVDAPDDANLRFELAAILTKLGDTRKAEHWFEVASELNARPASPTSAAGSNVSEQQGARGEKGLQRPTK